MKIGDRVVTSMGDVGIIEHIDKSFASVRLLTPKNKPSCLLCDCLIENLIDGTNVLPQPRSKEWLLESINLYEIIMKQLENLNETPKS